MRVKHIMLLTMSLSLMASHSAPAMGANPQEGRAVAPAAAPVASPDSPPAAATTPASLIHKPLAQPPLPRDPQKPMLAMGYADNPYIIAWPRDADGNLLEGRAVLMIRVAKDGRPVDVIISSSSGHRALDAIAIEGGKRMQFHPALRDGVPVEGYVRFPYDIESK